MPTFINFVKLIVSQDNRVLEKNKTSVVLIINPKLIDEFSLTHANARKSLAAWRKAVSEAGWKKNQDVMQAFPNAKMLKNKRARFEILHNTYRIVVELDYEDNIIEVRFIGTHSEYDKIDATTI